MFIELDPYIFKKVLFDARYLIQNFFIIRKIDLACQSNLNFLISACSSDFCILGVVVEIVCDSVLLAFFGHGIIVGVRTLTQRLGHDLPRVKFFLSCRRH